MTKKFQLKLTLIMAFILASHTTKSATIEQSIKISLASGLLCKIYAEEVGGDVQAFSEMNILALQFSEEMGYTTNLQSFTSEVDKIKILLKKELQQRYSSKLNVYNDWCIRTYEGFQKGVAKAYK